MYGNELEDVVVTESWFTSCLVFAPGDNSVALDVTEVESCRLGATRIPYRSRISSQLFANEVLAVSANRFGRAPRFSPVPDPGNKFKRSSCQCAKGLTFCVVKKRTMLQVSLNRFECFKQNSVDAQGVSGKFLIKITISDADKISSQFHRRTVKLYFDKKTNLPEVIAVTADVVFVSLLCGIVTTVVLSADDDVSL